MTVSLVLFSHMSLFAKSPGESFVWSSPTNLSTSTFYAGEPQVCLDQDDNAVAVWELWEEGQKKVQAAFLPKGGCWSSTVNLSSPEAMPFDPRVAVDSRGNVIAAWAVCFLEAAGAVIQAAILPKGGQWTSPVTISRPANEYCFDPQIATDPQGNIIIVWNQDLNDVSSCVQSATFSWASGWSAPVDLSPCDQQSYSPVVGVDSEGRVIAVWSQKVGENHIVMQASTRGSDSTWTSPMSLSLPGGEPYGPKLAFDGMGNTRVLWTCFHEEGSTIQSAALVCGEGWSTPQDLSPSGKRVYDGQIAMDSKGNAVAIWELDEEDCIQASSCSSGLWSAPVNISHPLPGFPTSYHPKLKMDSEGNAFAIWVQASESDQLPSYSFVQAAVLPLGGEWTNPITNYSFGSRSSYPAFVVDTTGNVLMVWKQMLEENKAIQAASLVPARDGAEPK